MAIAKKGIHTGGLAAGLVAQSYKGLQQISGHTFGLIHGSR
jgi:hypothetical protein